MPVLTAAYESRVDAAMSILLDNRLTNPEGLWVVPFLCWDADLYGRDSQINYDYGTDAPKGQKLLGRKHPSYPWQVISSGVSPNLI